MMGAFEFLAWVMVTAIIFGMIASIIIFCLIRRERIKAVGEFKNRKKIG